MYNKSTAVSGGVSRENTHTMNLDVIYFCLQCLLAQCLLAIRSVWVYSANSRVFSATLTVSFVGTVIICFLPLL